MATENPHEIAPEVLAADEASLVPATLTPPPGASTEELREIENKALVVVQSIVQDPDDRESLRQATRTGEDAQQTANQEFSLLRASMGKVMDRMKQSREASSIPNDLQRLRDIMDEINPYPAIEQMKRARTAGFFTRLIKGVPGVGKILSDIAHRYESVQTQVDAVIQTLESAIDKLMENSFELEQRYKNLKDLQTVVKLCGYELHYILLKLKESESELTDEAQKHALAKAVGKVTRRLQNLKVTENAFAQFFVTMNTTLDNHENLRDAVRSSIDLVRPVLENGLALKIAQQDEKQIAQALEATQDYLGQLMVNVAQDAMDNAETVAKVANRPLANLQDLVKAYNILTSRMGEAMALESQMLQNAEQNIKQLEQMTATLEGYAHSQERGREAAEQA